MRPSFTRLDLLLLSLTLIWGTNYSIVKAALRELPPQGFNALRMLLGGALFVAVILARHGRSALLSRFTRAEWIAVLGLAIVGHAIYQTLFIAGIARTSAANTSLIFGLTPVTVALLSSALGHERIGPLRWAGVAVSLGGIGLVVSEASRVGASPVGDGILGVAMVCWSAYTVGSRPLLVRHSPLVVTGYTMAIGSLFYAPVGLPALVHADLAGVSAAAWAGLIGSATLALFAAYLIWYTAVQRVGNSRTAVYSNVVPLVAMVTAVLLLGEAITVRKLAGAALVLAGVALTRLDASPGVSEAPVES